MSDGNDFGTGGGPLISLEGLTKPATVLIERVSDAIGTLFRPRQIIREARAEAEADKIRAIAGIEISEIEQRGLVRFVKQQGREQSNIENIVAQAIPDLKSDSTPESIDEDWLVNFFEKCKNISDKDMQILWGKLLAGEANQPYTYSKRTVELVSNLDKSDAELFTSLCKFLWVVSAIPQPIIFEPNEKIVTDRGISFKMLAHLDDIGLITFHPIGLMRQHQPRNVFVSYYSTLIGVELPAAEENTLETGKVMFTKAGEELAPICGAEPEEEILENTIKRWSQTGYVISSFYPPPNFEWNR